MYLLLTTWVGRILVELEVLYYPIVALGILHLHRFIFMEQGMVQKQLHL